MFLLAGVQNVALATLPVEHRWVPALFSVLFLVSAVICFIDPVNTFAGLADMLGFLFLLVGVWWMVQSFLERPVNPLWWLGLISGILMTGMAFWTAGQLFATKAYTLLVFAGIWALMQGTIDIVRAFEVRRRPRGALRAPASCGRPAPSGRPHGGGLDARGSLKTCDDRSPSRRPA